MQHFLGQIAQAFYVNERTQLSRYAFVFPNKRAGLFFKKQLSELVAEPIFAPQIFSINEFFLQYTDFKIEGKIPLLFRLYDVFRQWEGYESFEHFLPWGEMLLSDFDDVQKYSVDAQQLFRNIADLKEIDEQFADFTTQQREQLRQFWEKLLPLETAKEFGRGFVEKWRTIYPAYEAFNARLTAEKVGYEGLVFADALQRLRANVNGVQFEKVIFVGFNALNNQERALMNIFKTLGKADFYWDTQSEFFCGATDADTFVKANARTFPSKYTLEFETIQRESLDVIAVSSGVGQAKCVHDILDDLQTKYPENAADWLQNTAVVLPDEKLLMPTLCSIPENIGTLNVTMGYPLALARVHVLAHNLLEMQMFSRERKDGVATFYYKHVLAVLSHDDVQRLSARTAEFAKKINDERRFWVEDRFFADDEFLTSVFRKVSSGDLLNYLIEILKQIYVALAADEVERQCLVAYIALLNQLQSNVARAALQIEMETLASLVEQTVVFSHIPFKGEPLRGLQLMGFLETRSLDFENVIVTSMNEGVFPKSPSTSSVVPYALRKAFGLPTYEEHERIAAYYFYRLLSRAKRVYLLYDDRVNDTQQTGEISRFVYQLKYLFAPKDLREKSVVFDVNFAKNNKEIRVEKTDAIMAEIQRFATPFADGGRSLSASALNSYIKCPLSFYLSKIVGIDEPDEMSENIEANVFGSIFHTAMEMLYKNRKHIDKEAFVQIDAAVENAVNFAFSKEYLRRKETDEVECPTGRNELVTNVIKKYVRNTLKFDKQIAEFEIVDCERKTQCSFPIFGGAKAVNLYGVIDRIHCKNGKYFVVDYKTGKDALEYKSCAQLFDREDKDQPKAVFQTLMYALMLSRGETHFAPDELVPNVYSIKEIAKHDFNPYLKEKGKKKEDNKLENYGEIADEYEQRFGELLEEIFNREVAFTQCSDAKKCEYCNFKTICGRE